MANAKEVLWSVQVQGFVQLGTHNALTILASEALINLISAISFKIVPRPWRMAQSSTTSDAQMPLVQELMRTVHHR